MIISHSKMKSIVPDDENSKGMQDNISMNTIADSYLVRHWRLNKQPF